MFKQELTYIDFNNETRTETFYFHLSSPEVIRIQAELGKPIDEYAQDLAVDKDLGKMLDFMEKLTLNAYGKKTSDGKSFHKSKELRAEFEYSPAYAELFEKLITNHDLARKFASGIVDNGKTKKNQVAPQVIAE